MWYNVHEGNEQCGIELHCGPAPLTQQSRSSRKVKPMIDFEEELKKFQPSKEVDDTEETIRKRNITDMTDIMRQLLKEVRENQ